ncbi:recombinase family protein [Nocardia sp. BSTN01]|nr:recombinase family protein [Nocardia sp. BSTN01]
MPDPAVAYLRISDKKQLNTARIVKEFVEPGVSAQSIEKRAVFQEMLVYLKEHPEIEYVIVYALSRAFRNYIDAAVTKRQLDMMGVKLISARKDFDDGIYADMMAAITDIFNDIQNKLSGQDISIKMLNKAMNGGTCGRANLGYVNARILVEGRQVNTIQCFYIDDLEDTVAPRVTDEKVPVFADLHTAAHRCTSPQTTRSKRLKENRIAPKVCGSNKDLTVVPAGFEPATSRVQVPLYRLRRDGPCSTSGTEPRDRRGRQSGI